MVGLMFINANVFTGRGEVFQPGYVIIDNGLIAEIGAGSAPGTVRDDLAVIDAQGGWLLPGFIDAHVHLCYAHLGTSSATDDEASQVGKTNARAKLLSGVTTVRDVGGFNQLNLALKTQIAKGEIVDPRMLASGDFLSTPTGQNVR